MIRFLMFIFAALFATACTKSDKTLKFGVKKSETVVVNLQTEPPSLDWHKATDTTSHEVTMNIMDGLAEFDYADPNLKAIPALASKWESDKAAKKWTIDLKQGVKWTDGVEFEAQHVIDAWERLLNPHTASEYAYFLFGIKNAQAYNEGKIKDFSQVGVKADGKYKVIVELHTPMSFFPSLLVHHSTHPMRVDVVAKHGDAWTKPGNLVSLGAYKLKAWEHDEAILLERNDEYYGEKAKVKYVLGRMITEQSSAVNAFDAGEIDLIPELPSNDISILKNRDEFMSQSNLALFYFGFNTKQPPLDDVNFRRAVAQAIDKTEVVKILNKGDVAATSWIPQGMLGYSADLGLKFDPVAAKEHLSKSKYSDITKIPRVTITYNTNENHKKVAENVQAQLKRNLGINVEILNEEWKVYLAKLKTKQGYSIFRMGWVADYPDPDNFLNLLTSFSANNHTNWKNPEFDKLIAQGVGEFDAQKRQELYVKAQKIVLEQDVAVLPIYYMSRQYLVNPRIKGFAMNVLDHKVYRKMSVE
jgi:oligopeptide transport system substrate-binding protein